MKCTLSLNELEEIITNVFAGFSFDDVVIIQFAEPDITIYELMTPGVKVFLKKDQYKGEYFFSLIEYEIWFRTGEIYHKIENKKGEFARAFENIILLEKPQAASSK